jgi:glycosyltransferase involved in cell wall biosynthesis
MKPYLSIVIPYHNDSHSIQTLLRSIALSKKAPYYEVILVDDGSSLSERFIKPDKKLGKMCVRFTSLYQSNRGPAAARNKGAKLAKGNFLVFFDSDVELFPDTLAEIKKSYTDDPDIVAITGVWVKEQKSHKFFPNFKALRDWSYWINERDTSGYYFLFSTRVASIKRTVFERLKGFDESYDAALVEDIELTYRIARRYAIIFAPKVRVKHEFEDFWPIAKKYFWRAYHWTKLFKNRKKFDPVATTIQEALSAITGVLVIVFAVVSIVSIPYIPLLISVFQTASAPLLLFAASYYFLFLFFITIHLILNKTFLFFAAKERGVWFSIQSFGIGLLLYCFIFAGALWGRIRK